MKNLFLMGLAISLLSLFACKKDSSTAPNSNQNNNQNNDPCANVTCLHGGTCANGGCNCPEKWEGTDCSLQKKPVSITIHSVTATSYPSTKSSGGGWDLWDGPDIYLQISQNGSMIFDGNYYENASGSKTWSVNKTIDPATCNFMLLDYDSTSGDDYMGGVTKSMYTSTNNFPSTIYASAGGISFNMSVSYNY